MGKKSEQALEERLTAMEERLSTLWSALNGNVQALTVLKIPWVSHEDFSNGSARLSEHHSRILALEMGERPEDGYEAFRAELRQEVHAAQALVEGIGQAHAAAITSLERRLMALQKRVETLENAKHG